ncbi:MAG: MBL fold metallo-hydrolase, partial [Solobacterium sp.]|nr:MBL fold metallo-hydrolase [Solobacterium sp.]
MYLPKKFGASLLALMMMVPNGAFRVLAEEAPAEDPAPEVTEERDIEAEKEAFKAALEKDGYAEIGSYKVEKMRDGVYHMDEETKAFPGGSTLDPYIDRVTGEEVSNVMNNPSSMYFVVTDNEVVMIDGGDVLRSQEKYDSAKAILDVMTDGKPLTFIITHGHSDHVRMITTEGVLDDINVKAIYVGEDDYVDGQVVGSTTGTPLPVQGDLEKVHTVKEGDVIEVDGLKYEIIDIPCHTPGSLAIVQPEKEVIFTGDSIGSGFVWAFWMYGDNPLGALQNGVQKLQGVIQGMGNGTILAGHRWQQFASMFGINTGEIGIQYLNDMNALLNGLADGTTAKNPYTLRGNDLDIELSATGSRARIDTQQECIDAYLEALVKMDEAYIYSGADKLSIESVNAVAAPTFIIYPDEILSDEDAKKLVVDSGIAEIVDRSASKAYVMRSYDVDDFKTVMQTKVAVTENFKLIGIGNGATFINNNLSKYVNSVSGLALIGGEGTPAPSASVPAYISGADASAYIAADKAEKTAEEGTFTTYVNPDSRFELVVTNSAEEDAVTGIKNAWDKVLNKFGRIGNWLDNSAGVGAVGTWYTRPLITGDDAVDTTRPYQYFDSIEAITDIRREVITEDLDGDGQLNLWYEYIPAKAEDAEEGTVPVVLLMHGNTNDPRTQYDCSGWANIASREGIILVAPEWQGHTYQGYTYQPMVMTTEDVDSADFVKMIKMIEEKYPQIDASRIYIQGLSAGSRNTYMQGLANAKYLAAGAGQSGPFGVSGGANFADVTRNKDKYDFPIIFFSGDADEYLMGTYDNTNVNAGSITTLNAFEALNDMAVTTADDLSMEYIADSGYPVKWDETYTIEQTPETVTYVKGGVKANDKNVEISFNRIYGWGHWNYMPDAEWQWEFMKKYARDLETGESIRLDLEPAVKPGVVIEENKDYPESDADFQVTFTYEASSKDVESVSLVGDWTFYKKEDIETFRSGTEIDSYSPYEYKDGMFNTGYKIGITGAGYAPIEMEKVGDGLFQVTLPLPGFEYFYGFAENGDLGNIRKDPTNMPVANGDSDSGWSLIWVGDADHTLEGQEYIYPRDDDQVGTVEFGTYKAVDGTEQPYGIYLPYGYDESKTYKVLYISHGGGGNEVEWMYIGAAKNIFDNLIADGELEPTVLVTMDNTYLAWDQPVVSDNMRNYLIPAIEAKYSVATDKEGRAFAGLSQGGYTATSEAVKSPDQYRYFGIFSANYRAKDLILEKATEEELQALAGNVYYQSVGWVDNGNGAQDRYGTIAYIDETLKKYATDVTTDYKYGAHDWGVWRAQLTTFAKDYLWRGALEGGVVIEPNTDYPEIEVDNQVTFTYVAPEGTQDVALIGNFHFYYPEEVISYVAGHRFQTYTPYEYEPDMYNTGYDVAAYGYMEFAMDNVAGNVWQITMPLPGTQYFYDFVVTDKDGKKTTIKDPTNLPFANNGADSGHSLIYVGDKDHCIEGQEYIYPREDEKVGTVEYVDYTDINGDKRTIGVYLPYGYDVNGNYKTLYLCHGGGGNEVEWFNIGSAKNIYDNLIAEGEVEPTVVITMNNTVYNFERGPSVDNILKVIKPLVEAKYAVSKEADDRAIAGLSSGASVTDQAALENNDEFAYYGIFSPSRTLNFIKTNGVNTVTPEQKKAFGEHGFYYVSVGEFDSFVRRDVNVDTYDELVEDGAKTVFFWKPGAHDWAVWRNQLTEFTKDYLWDALDDRFADVRDESKYYYNAVYWARDLGITKGYA